METNAKPCTLLPFFDPEPYRLPTESRDTQLVYPIAERLWKAYGPFQYILRCGKVKYNMLMRFNKDVSECVENLCLRDIYRSLENGDRKIHKAATQKALSLFLKFVDKHYRARVESSEVSEGPAVRIQIKTVGGKLVAVGHELEYDLEGGAIQNPLVDVKKIAQEDVKRIRKISRRIYLVEVDGAFLCLKVSRWRGEEQFSQEIRKMHSLPRHPNLIHLVGVADAGNGKIEGMLMPFVNGQNLQFVKSINKEKKKKWESEIQRVVTFLHAKDIIWGDAKPENIIIDEATDTPILFDFEGGSTLGWVSDELENTKEGDLQGLGRILNLWIKFLLDKQGYQLLGSFKRSLMSCS